jgi:hypothetical protein
MKNKQKLTRWFPPSVKPAYAGIYLTRSVDLKHDGVFRYWDGSHWSFMDDFSQPNLGLIAPRQWRGLAEQPK